MNVIDLLKKDHENVSALFKAYEDAPKEGGETKASLARQIRQELTVHAMVEEELFYPRVESKANKDDEAETLVKEAHEEHHVVKALLAELLAMTPDDEPFDAKLTVLKEVVEHHVEEEEGELMPKAKKLLSTEELEEMGAQAERRKEELGSQPEALEGVETAAKPERPERRKARVPTMAEGARSAGPSSGASRRSEGSLRSQPTLRARSQSGDRSRGQSTGRSKSPSAHRSKSPSAGRSRGPSGAPSGKRSSSRSGGRSGSRSRSRSGHRAVRASK
jgi:hemerythrin-like domain-containing protein